MSDSGQFFVVKKQRKFVNKAPSRLRTTRKCSLLFSFSLFFSVRGALSIAIIVVSIMRQIYAPFGCSWLFLLSSVDVRDFIFSSLTPGERFTRTLEARCKSAFSMLGAV